MPGGSRLHLAIPPFGPASEAGRCTPNPLCLLQGVGNSRAGHLLSLLLALFLQGLGGEDALSKCFFFFFFSFLLFMAAPEVPRLGVRSELQPPAYITATAMQDPSHIFDLHHSSWQRWIPNPRSEARDGTHILTNILSGS